MHTLRIWWRKLKLFFRRRPLLTISAAFLAADGVIEAVVFLGAGAALIAAGQLIAGVAIMLWPLLEASMKLYVAKAAIASPHPA